MSADVVQSGLVLVLVAAAALYLGVRAFRSILAARARRAEGCGSGCGCSPAGGGLRSKERL